MNAHRALLVLAICAAVVSPVSAFDSTAAVSNLRLFNPTERELAATVVCASSIRTFKLAPGAIVDIAAEDLEPCHAQVRILADDDDVAILDTDGQRLIRAALQPTCPFRVPMSLPLSGCRLGTATASVASLDKVTYVWSVVGGSILSCNGTPRISLSLGNGASTQVSVTVTMVDGCPVPGEGVIALREPFAATVTTDSGRVGDPMTIRWSFTGGVPTTQTLEGTDFPQPVVQPANMRSRTYTPSATGAKELPGSTLLNLKVRILIL